MTVKVFRVHGTTDDCTECELCGRVDLKKTVILIELDAAGNDLDAVYYGEDCASKAAGWTQKETRARVRAADHAAREAESAARHAEWDRREAEEAEQIAAWALARYGISPSETSRSIKLWNKVLDALTAAHPRRPPISFLKEFYATRNAA